MLLDNTVVVPTGAHVQPGACSEPQQLTTSNKVSPAPFGDINLNVTCRQAPSLVSDADQSATVVNPSSPLSLAFSATFGLMGVSDGAFEAGKQFMRLQCAPCCTSSYQSPLSFLPSATASLLVLLCTALLNNPFPVNACFHVRMHGSSLEVWPSYSRKPVFFMTLPFSWSSGFLALVLRWAPMLTSVMFLRQTACSSAGVGSNG
jgi:hypothetical protein